MAENEKWPRGRAAKGRIRERWLRAVLNAWTAVGLACSTSSSSVTGPGADGAAPVAATCTAHSGDGTGDAGTCHQYSFVGTCNWQANPLGLEMGPCPIASALGCCFDSNGFVQDCAYDVSSVSTVQHEKCVMGEVYAPPADAGAAASGFFGTWTGSAGLGPVASCYLDGSTTSTLVNRIVVAQGPSSPVIVTATGCVGGGYSVSVYSLSGDVATTAAPAALACHTTTDAGFTNIAVVPNTLTLSADGSTLTWTATVNITVEAINGPQCTVMVSGTFTKA